eukprot:TRINITY_DN3595_c0_g1_i2.p1 TRINITY_DN3595_c0_g1~~TRINITY_DN3595_c0_g1_i2.p1  ORF type:complete len:419 (-),score=168.34 TRINITY_DN3595_c0_g1_i2:71-1327(-)
MGTADVKAIPGKSKKKRKASGDATAAAPAAAVEPSEVEEEARLLAAKKQRKAARRAAARHAAMREESEEEALAASREAAEEARAGRKKRRAERQQRKAQEDMEWQVDEDEDGGASQPAAASKPEKVTNKKKAAKVTEAQEEAAEEAAPSDAFEGKKSKKQRKASADASEQAAASQSAKGTAEAAVERQEEDVKGYKTDWRKLDGGMASASFRMVWALEGEEDYDTAMRAKRENGPISDGLRVFVRNLPANIDEERLRKDFLECGEIANLKLLTDRDTGASRGMAFITFKEEAGLKAALGYDGDDYGGKTLRVSKAAAQGQGRGSGPPDPGLKPEGCNSVVLKGLSLEVAKDDLWKLFAKCGGKGPTHVGILFDKAGKSRGTARIDFATTAAVDEAIKLNGSELKGKAFHMGYCKPKTW